MTVVGYIFQVGHDPDIPDQMSQQKELESYAARLGIKMDNCCVEMGMSIKRPFGKRSEGTKILGELAEGDVLLTCKAEWILGSAREGLNLLTLLEEKGVALYCRDLDENISLPEERKLLVSEGKADFTKKLLRSLAVCETSKHGESIKAAKRQMVRDGRYIGGPVPFGWCVKDGFLKRDREQQKVIRQMKKWRLDRWSYRDIAVKLSENLGIKLSHEGVRKVLLSSDTAGERKNKNPY